MTSKKEYIAMNSAEGTAMWAKVNTQVDEYEGKDIYSQTCKLKCIVCGNDILVQNITNDFYGDTYFKNYCLKD